MNRDDIPKRFHECTPEEQARRKAWFEEIDRILQPLYERNRKCRENKPLSAFPKPHWSEKA